MTETLRKRLLTLRESRIYPLGLLALLLACLAILIPGDGVVAQQPAAATAVGSAAKPAERQREGTVLTDVVGYFKLTGDRATFFTSDGTARYGGLENLNLERVALVIAEHPEQLEWSVSGKITEYRGANYLLISRAILKSRPATKDRLKPEVDGQAASTSATR